MVKKAEGPESKNTNQTDQKKTSSAWFSQSVCTSGCQRAKVKQTNVSNLLYPHPPDEGPLLPGLQEQELPPCPVRGL